MEKENIRVKRNVFYLKLFFSSVVVILSFNFITEVFSFKGSISGIAVLIFISSKLILRKLNMILEEISFLKK